MPVVRNTMVSVVCRAIGISEIINVEESDNKTVLRFGNISGVLKNA